MACRWATPQKQEAVNLLDIMSEELARDLQDKENRKCTQMLENASLDENKEEPVEPEGILDDDVCQSDATIAQMLQMQYDREYDENLKKTEAKVNGDAKVSLSYQKHQRAPYNFGNHIEYQSD